MKSGLRAIAQETVEITRRGSYVAGGREVVIGEAVARAVAGTVLHLPDEPLAVPPAGTAPSAEARVEVTGESTLEAARRLGEDVACLVFASARNPGGGFLNGAQAQEEAIARSSALHACLESVPAFYAHHRAHPELVYTDRVIHSPGVPVFRADDGALLPQPHRAAFLTAAAPNRGAVATNQPDRLADVRPALLRRAERVLRVAAHHGHRRLVLGAWGCGVFRNEPGEVAEAFATALAALPAFDHVVFAILDRARDSPVRAAFTARFGGS
ncbi:MULTISPECIES: TIGR02452 family protein [Actinosynnema]|uniref:TIGR02452 family protein n=1 Tax=Actinosynnema TaxID=40566 RepID=UPI0020A51811|nr:TIGR02452 family protein [Actinosynnema pretiosum]MCP2092375.1 TIGR02452 family protein [Actinosynnema pretiosum]